MKCVYLIPIGTFNLYHIISKRSSSYCSSNYLRLKTVCAKTLNCTDTPHRKSIADNQMVGRKKEKENFQTDIYRIFNDQYICSIISKTCCMALEVIRIPAFRIIHS